MNVNTRVFVYVCFIAYDVFHRLILVPYRYKHSWMLKFLILNGILFAYNLGIPSCRLYITSRLKQCK